MRKKLAAVLAIAVVLTASIGVYAATGSLDEWKANLIEERTADLKEAVDEGRMTQERADLILEHMTERITEADPEDCAYGEGGQGYGGGHARRGGGMMGGGFRSGSRGSFGGFGGQGLGNDGVCPLAE